MIPPEIFPLILYALSGLLVVVFLLLIRIEMRLKCLLKGTGAKTIEDSLSTIERELKELQSFRKSASLKISTAEKELDSSIQGVGIVRFTPFKGTSGSNQSFAMAFLNKHGDGVIISSIYSREHVSIFAKPIKNKESEYGLSEEEREAIKKASGS